MKYFVLTILMAGPAMATQLPVMQNFEKDQVCATYNEYVDTQCVSKADFAKLVDAKISKGYVEENCRRDSFQMILETDVKANAACELTVAASQPISLKDKASKTN